MIDLVAALRGHPLLSGIEVLDWRVTGKGTPGWIGVMNHHTVSGANSGRYPSRTVVTKGRPDVSGPLCNILGARGGGSIAVITDGEANHAGAGDPNVTRRALAGHPPPPGRPGPDQTGADGRHYWLGIEWENNGTGEPWAPLMLDTMYHLNAALCDIFAWDPLCRVVQHAEWSGRKIDCAFVNPKITYPEFRRSVAALLTTQEGPPMSAAEVDAIKAHVTAETERVLAEMRAHHAETGGWLQGERAWRGQALYRLDGRNAVHVIQPGPRLQRISPEELKLRQHAGEVDPVVRVVPSELRDWFAGLPGFNPR